MTKNMQVFIGDKPVNVSDSCNLVAEDVETKTEWSNKSFTGTMTVEDTPELRAFLKATTDELKNRQKEIEKHLTDLVAGYLMYNKEGADEMEKEMGKEFTEWFLGNIRNAVMSGLRLGWNECYKYHNGKFNG